jgi:hypothetical protein
VLRGCQPLTRLQGEPLATLPEGVKGERSTNDISVVLLHPLSEVTPRKAKLPPPPSYAAASDWPLIWAAFARA